MTKWFKFPNDLMVFVCSTLILLIPGPVLGQTAPVSVRDPNAVALASRALQALGGGTTVTDITLAASATYTAGSDLEMGPATLVALGNQQSRVTLNLTNGQRQEIRSGIEGRWLGADGTAHYLASHNNFVDAAWFYPAFILQALATDPTLSISLVGQQALGAEPVYHLALWRVVTRRSPMIVALIQHLSAMDLYLDATTLAPVEFDFNIHPDANTGVDIPVSVRFGAYQAFNGVQAPTRIQKYLQGSLELDMTVASASINSGVPASLFTLPIVPAGGAQ